jgi:tetratricopeptide (TPR) repeat protein
MLKIVAMLAALAFSASLPAQVNVPTNRAQALEGLAAADATRRADAVIWIASNGTYPDEAILRKRLADENPIVRELAEQGVWLLWGRSGDDRIDALMARAASEAQAGNLDAAIATYTEVIKRKPAFAEGWNKRATVLFVKRDFRRSLADCEEVIKRNPNHFGALSGYGQIYFELEQYEKAIGYWKRALKANPNLAGLETNIAVAEKVIAQRQRNSI